MYDILQHPTSVCFALTLNWQKSDSHYRWKYNFWHIRMSLAEDLKGLKLYFIIQNLHGSTSKLIKKSNLTMGTVCLLVCDNNTQDDFFFTNRSIKGVCQN